MSATPRCAWRSQRLARLHIGSPTRAQPAESTAQAGSGARRGMRQLWEHGSYSNRLGWRVRFVLTLRDVTQSQGVVSSSVTGRAGRGLQSEGREFQGEAACPGLDTQQCCVYTGPCVVAPALLCSPSRRFQFLDRKDPREGRSCPVPPECICCTRWFSEAPGSLWFPI